MLQDIVIQYIHEQDPRPLLLHKSFHGSVREGTANCVDIQIAIARSNDLKFVLFGPITFYFINYYFSKKGNGAIIIKDQSYSVGKYSFLLDVFGFASFKW